ncbi:MAG: hypothetical protein AAGJ93_08735, partial [Bacteroidota bacterium]
MTLTVTLPDNCFKLQMTQPMSVADFYVYSRANPELVMELEPDGSISVMSPVNYRSGEIENLFSSFLTIWNLKNKLGNVL